MTAVRKTAPALRQTNASLSLVFVFADQAPIFFHRLDVGLGETRGDVDFSIGNAFVDLELGDWPAVHKDKQQAAAPFDAERFQGHAAMFVELNQRAIAIIRRMIRI